ncbi:MAG TPA: hypothetical protein VEB66_14420 [Opitutaceae bacterium]|nr:hypothetical protein [Opitutaceae bacterium]
MRQRLLYLAFIVLPLAVYFPVLINEYGQGGDFAMLHLAKSEGAVAGVDPAYGETVLYRALLDSSFRVVNGVEALWLLRLVAVLLLGVLGALIWRQLDNSGWPELDSAALGMMIILLPAAQATAGWALSWPRTLALLFAVAGFAAVETELEAGGLKRAVAVLGGAFIYALATMIRPELVFFGLVPLGAVMLVRIRKSPTSQSVGTWLSLHLGVLAAGWIAGRLLEHWASGDPIATLEGAKQASRWFFLEAAPGALAQFPLLDDHNVGAWYFWPVLLAVVAAILYAFRIEQTLDGEKARFKGLMCGLGLPSIILAAMLVSGEVAPAGYREAYPLSALTAVALFAGWRTMLRAKRIKSWAHYFGLAGVIALAAILAHWNTQSLIATPRAEEWSHVQASIASVSFKSPQRVHLISAGEEDRNTERTYGREFGAMASTDEAILRQMFEAVLRKRFPGGLPRGGGTDVTVSAVEPPAGAYDVLVDMRKLRAER